jgi:hypothetical protein
MPNGSAFGAKSSCPGPGSCPPICLPVPSRSPGTRSWWVRRKIPERIFPWTSACVSCLERTCACRRFGLNAHLTGDVDVIDIQDRPPQILGEVSVLEGNYRAWGQNLTVEEGLILFQGPPDTPGPEHPGRTERTGTQRGRRPGDHRHAAATAKPHLLGTADG